MKKIFLPVFFALFYFFAIIGIPAQSGQPSGAPVLGSRSAVVMDAATGRIVFEQNPDLEIPPASLTKLMTMHLAFNEIDEGRVSLKEYLYPPRESWGINQPPGSSLMHLANGQRLTLYDLLLGLAIFSGNDAAVAAALFLSPSMEEFVEAMNKAAASIGMTSTVFVEPSGISEFNMTTARDYALFCRFYINAHPNAMRDFHSVLSFTYPRAENILDAYRGMFLSRHHYNHNTLLGKVEGVDGLKTGYIDESGYNIALTAERDGTRFIAVVLGAPAEWGGDTIRDTDGRNLLNWAFANYKTIYPEKPDLQPVKVWKGNANYVNLIPAEPLEFTSGTDRGDALYIETILYEPLIAPFGEGMEAGMLIISDNKGELRRVALLTETQIPQGNFFKRLWDSILLFFRKSN